MRITVEVKPEELEVRLPLSGRSLPKEPLIEAMEKVIRKRLGLRQEDEVSIVERR